MCSAALDAAELKNNKSNNSLQNHTTYKKDVEPTASKRTFKSQSMFGRLSTHVADEDLLRPSLVITACCDGRWMVLIYTSQSVLIRQCQPVAHYNKKLLQSTLHIIKNT